MAFRFTQINPIQPKDDFFALPTETMTAGILARDAQANVVEERYNKGLAALNELQFEPTKDLAVANRRKQDLITKERQLRDSVGGDVTDSRYQRELDKLMQNETSDPFYKVAAWNLQSYQNHDKGLMDYVSKTGNTPQDWQDPFKARLQQFRGSEAGDLLAFDGITERRFLMAEAKEYMENFLKTQSGDTAITSRRMGDGTLILEKGGLEITEDQVVNMLKMQFANSIPIEHEKNAFLANPDLVAQYGSFDQYADQVLYPGIAKLYSRSVKTESYKNYTRDRQAELTKARASSKAKSPRQKDMADFASDFNSAVRVGLEDNSTAIEPLGVSSYQASQREKAVRTLGLNNIINGIPNKNGDQIMTDPETGEIDYKVPPLDKIITSKVGITSADGRVTIEPNAGGFMVPMLRHVDKNGIVRNLDMSDYNNFLENAHRLDPGLVERYKQNWGDIYEKDILPMHNHKVAIDEYDRIENKLLAKHFNANELEKYKKYGSKGVVGAGQVTAAYFGGGLTMSSIDSVMEEVQNMTPSEFRTFQDKTTNVVSGNKWIKRLNDIQEASKSNLTTAEIADMARNNPEGFQALTMDAYTDKFLEEKDPRYKKFLDDYNKMWTNGMTRYGDIIPDESLLGGKGVETGQKLGTKRIFMFTNQGDTEESKQIRGLNRLVSEMLSVSTPEGDIGRLPLFFRDSNKRVTDPEMYEKLATNYSKNGENYPGFTVVGFADDGQGMSIVIKPGMYNENGDIDKTDMPLLEIRDSEAITNLLHESGFEHATTLQSMADLKQSLTVTAQQDQSGSILLDGQARHDVTGIVGHGQFSVPVRKVAFPVKDEHGVMHPAGTLIYKPKSPNLPTKYLSNELDVVFAYQEDMAYYKEANANKMDITPEDLPDNVSIKDNNVNLQNLSRNVGNALLNYTGPKQIISDAHRPKTATFGARFSKHHVGNAYDVRVQDPKSGIVDNKVIDWYFLNTRGNGAWGNQNGVTAKLAFPAEALEKGTQMNKMYNKYKTKYGDFVTIHGTGTGLHLHVEGN